MQNFCWIEVGDISFKIRRFGLILPAAMFRLIVVQKIPSFSTQATISYRPSHRGQDLGPSRPKIVNNFEFLFLFHVLRVVPIASGSRLTVAILAQPCRYERLRFRNFKGQQLRWQVGIVRE